MGEGVANILGLIVDLCIADEKIFLIEEPENDIHPKALKTLLNLIIEKSTTNQFFISTHSNIVAKYLGSVSDAKLFNITNNERDSEREKLFISRIEVVPNNHEARRRVLEDLGYEFFRYVEGLAIP
ncbi:MAG: ATP-binding protein [Bacteroidetes bacterium]|nr:ATP-binding protein [Bacteroidota bacterium]